MAKSQRRSINDALAEIAAQAQEPATLPVGRDHVVSDHTPQSTLARIDIPTAVLPAPSPHGGRDHVTTHHLSAGTDEEGYRVRVRREKPHVSFYAHPRVFAAIRDLANAQRRKPHDLYVEGMRLMLAQYGLDFDELDGR